jgi:inhibitor of cysteine peptidase
MKSTLISLVAFGIIFSALVVGLLSPAYAALCGKCQDLMFTDSQGKCIDCGGPTTSAALQLCPKCSAKRHQCEHCLAKLSDKEVAAADNAPAAVLPGPALDGDSESHDPPSPAAAPASSPSAPVGTGKDNDTGPELSAPALPPNLPSGAKAGSPPVLPGPADAAQPDPAVSPKLKPINPARAGTYTAGKWRFQLEIREPGTRNEGRWGWLTYDGQKLPRGNVNDYYVTPWGPMYWVDVPKAASGLHGFMPVPLPRTAGRPSEDGARVGRALALPANLAGTATTPNDAAPGAAAASNAKVKTLEINRSHNGQLAQLHIGNMLIVRLPGNPASGFQWQISTSNTQALKMTVRPQYSPPTPTASGPAPMGTYTFVFQAVQPGTGALRLYYVRPGDTNRPRDSFAIGVNVTSATATVSAQSARTAAAR